MKNENILEFAKKAVKLFESKKSKRIFIAVTAVFLIYILGYYVAQTEVMPQASIYLLNNIKIPKEGQKVLVFAPHPDDETLGAGGLIYDSIQNKADVKIVLVTDGNKWHNGQKRYAEFRKATEILGVPEKNLKFLGYSEAVYNWTGKDVHDKFKDIIDSYKPDFIVYPDIRDNNQAHRETGQAVNNIISEESRKGNFYQYLVHDFFFYPSPYKYEPEKYLLPPWKMLKFDQEWQRLMLSDNTEGVKTEAVLVYRSQFANPFNRNMMLSPIRKNELFEMRKN